MSKEVIYSKKLGQRLERTLRSAFNPKAELTKPPKNPESGFRVELIGTKTAQIDDQWTQMVDKILIADDDQAEMYFGFVACFQPATPLQYYLSDASLSVFQGIIGEPTPLFRAEWHRQGLSENSFHPQPHWDFSQTPGRIENIVRLFMRPPNEPSEFSPFVKSKIFSSLADCGRFHFAMTSMWRNSDQPPPKRRFETADFLEWFSGLADHTAKQIKYLADNMPRKEATTFAPNKTIE